MGKSRGTTKKPRSGSNADRPEIKIDIPQAPDDADPYAIWQTGGPGRLLSRLADEQRFGEATLTSDELAELVELFRDEPMPDSLRNAVLSQLRGKRIRRQGAPKARQTDLEAVELYLLPLDYAHALEEAAVEREELKRRGLKAGRYDDPNRLPTLSSLASDKIREWRPTLSRQSNRSIQNLVSKVKKMTADVRDEEAGTT